MRLVPRSDLATCGSWEFFEKRCFTWLVEGLLSIALFSAFGRRRSDALGCMCYCRAARKDTILTHSAAPSPPRIPRQRPAERQGPGARGQVDLAPGPDPGGAGGRRNPDFRPARGRGRAQYRQIHAGAGRQGRADRPVCLDGRRRRGRRLCRTGRGARFRQFRHRLPAGDGRGGGLPGDGDFRRRRLAAQPADAAHPRSAGTDGRQGRRDEGRRPAAADAARRARAGADHLPDAGGLGADQVRGAARRPCCARRHHRDRERGEPRPHRTDAEAFWRRYRLDRARAPTAARFR